MSSTLSEANENSRRELLELAERNGLRLLPGRWDVNESGMDFVVAFTQDTEGRDWVLRKPRREDVWERAVNERKVLQFIAGQLPAEVPDWRIFTPELIAYPLLGGHPVATVDPAGGGYAWKVPQEELPETFKDSLAAVLAALHRIDPEAAARAGIRCKSPAEARRKFAADMEEIRQSFAVPAKLQDRWNRWLSTDSFWPGYSALYHGDLHPPHLLVDEQVRVTGLIDWTEAEVADPGKDFVILYALFGEEGTRDLLSRYERAGGRTWPRMLEHIAELWAAYPVQVAKFALITGRDEDRQMAEGMMAHWGTE